MKEHLLRYLFKHLIVVQPEFTILNVQFPDDAFFIAYDIKLVLFERLKKTHRLSMVKNNEEDFFGIYLAYFQIK